MSCSVLSNDNHWTNKFNEHFWGAATPGGCWRLRLLAAPGGSLRPVAPADPGGAPGGSWRLRLLVRSWRPRDYDYPGYMTIKDTCQQGQKYCSVPMENDNLHNRSDHGYGWECKKSARTLAALLRDLCCAWGSLLDAIFGDLRRPWGSLLECNPGRPLPLGMSAGMLSWVGMSLLG